MMLIVIMIKRGLLSNTIYKEKGKNVMKKILLTAMILMTMACSSAFAGQTGNAFSVQEDTALSVITNMIGGQRNAVVTHFVSDMAEKYTEDAHKASVAGLAKEFGKISDVRLIQASRNYNDAGQYMSDNLLFLGKGSNGKTVAVSILFVNAGKKYKIASISFRPVEIRKQ